MLSIVWTAMKIGVITLAILVVSQVPIHGKKICDYAADVLDSRNSESVSRSLTKASHWVGARFNFLEARQNIDISKADKDELSAVLKKNAHRH